MGHHINKNEIEFTSPLFPSLFITPPYHLALFDHNRQPWALFLNQGQLGLVPAFQLFSEWKEPGERANEGNKTLIVIVYSCIRMLQGRCFRGWRSITWLRSSEPVERSRCVCSPWTQGLKHSTSSLMFKINLRSLKGQVSRWLILMSRGIR